MQQHLLNNILVIDEIPAIALGLQEIFRSVHPSVIVEHVENAFTALSAPRFEKKTFDLIILGSDPKDPTPNLYPALAELKGRFGNSRVMIYTTLYDYALIERMEMLDIDACVHKFESIEEVRKVYLHLSAGERCISDLLYTLFFEYQLNKLTTPHQKED
ncbi:MAG: response regulator transcription factor [Chitinophagaceae bacterium]|nr:response regulator transcription factor [Chitinophagaceae bacterium]